MRVGTHAHSRRARDSARLRAGICQTYDFIVQGRLSAGHLVKVPPLRGPHTSVFRRVCAASPPVGRVPHVDRHAGHIGGPGLHRLQDGRTVIERPASPAPECVAEGAPGRACAPASMRSSRRLNRPEQARHPRRRDHGRCRHKQVAGWRHVPRSGGSASVGSTIGMATPASNTRAVRPNTGAGARAREDETSHAHASVIEGRCRAMISFCPSAACRRSRSVRPPVCKRAEASR